VTSDERKKQLRVEVTYALPDQQVLLALEVGEGTTVREAIERSGVLARFPEIELKRGHVGIFGRATPLHMPLSDGDRVEIYRPLIADPKESRRERARRTPLKRPRR
jgi:hypothetical protein